MSSRTNRKHNHNNNFVIWLADNDMLKFNGTHYTCSGPCKADCEKRKECNGFGGGFNHFNNPTISVKRVKILKDTHAELFL